jgi:hypothetical protein
MYYRGPEGLLVNLLLFLVLKMVLVSNKGPVDDNLLVQLKLEAYEKQWVHFYFQLK